MAETNDGFAIADMDLDIGPPRYVLEPVNIVPPGRTIPGCALVSTFRDAGYPALVVAPWEFERFKDPVLAIENISEGTSGVLVIADQAHYYCAPTFCHVVELLVLM